MGRTFVRLDSQLSIDCQRDRFVCQADFGEEAASAVGWAERRRLVLDEGLARVGPIKRVGQRQVVVAQKGPQLFFQIGDRGEVAAADDLAHDGAEHDFNLIQPRAVLGQEHEADAMGGV